MSRAFVKETDAVEPLPERPVSAHPNYVTAQGLASIEAELAQLTESYAQAQAAGDRDALARLGRDLRYWQQRRAGAQLFSPATATGEVQFGSRVTIKRDDGRKQTWHIVGEDEADPAKGSVSYLAPVARALIGKRIGDVVEAGNGEAEIVAIENAQ
ncbi:MAG TPA: transcription elongation factor GreA [Pseudolabrys sp.]